MKKNKIDHELARRAVNAVFFELSGRAGISDALDGIREDSEVYQEMHHCCIAQVLAALSLTESPSSHERWQP